MNISSYCLIVSFSPSIDLALKSTKERIWYVRKNPPSSICVRFIFTSLYDCYMYKIRSPLHPGNPSGLNTQNTCHNALHSAGKLHPDARYLESMQVCISDFLSHAYCIGS